ncbi:MAG: acyltransferase family protein, partial [Angustibacter sp.]
ELRFYLLFLVFVVWRGVTYRTVVVFCAAWTLFGAVSYAAKDPLLDMLAMREHSPYFVAGLAFYLIYKYGGNPILWGIVAVSWLLGQHQTIKILWNPDPSKTTLPRSPYILLLLITICFVVMAAVSLGLLNRIQWRWLPAAGALTYPFYLVHEHIGWFSISFLYRHAGLSAPITALLTTLAMLLLAFAIHQVIELRFTPMLKRKLSGLTLEPPIVTGKNAHPRDPQQPVS